MRAAWVAAVVMASLGAGCLHSETVVSARAVHGSLPELRAEGEAEVEGHAVAMDAEVVAAGRRTTVAQLVDRCPDVRPWGSALQRASEQCQLLRVEDVSLGDEIDWGATAGLWVGATLAVAVVGVLVGLLISLDSSDSSCDVDCP